MLAPNVDRFLRNSLRSVWELELLLLIRKQPTRLWAADELIYDLRASAPIIGDALDALQKVGLVSKNANEQFQYWPVSPELGQLVEDLASTYATPPITARRRDLAALSLPPLSLDRRVRMDPVQSARRLRTRVPLGRC
jgi:hypothetical protein